MKFRKDKKKAKKKHPNRSVGLTVPKTPVSFPPTLAQDSGFLFRFLAFHWNALTSDFRHSALPFKRPACQSLWAGGSGILYVLPAFATPFLWESVLWILQAICSILADYTYVGQDHLVQGIDRWLATLMMIRLTVLFVLKTSIADAAAMLVIPISCFLFANKAKGERSLPKWIFYHTLWHFSGGAASAWVTYVIRKDDFI